MLKLPKNVLTHPQLPLLEAHFTATERVLREVEPGGRAPVMISAWPLDGRLKEAMTVVIRSKHLMQGLELMAQRLDREQKGLKAAQEKAGQPPPHRLSRLIFLSNDGSDRFYRDAESLLIRHADRAWGCVIDASSEQLGQAFTSKGNATKALMIDDRAALEGFLNALAQSLAAPG